MSSLICIHISNTCIEHLFFNRNPFKIINRSQNLELDKQTMPRCYWKRKKKRLSLEFSFIYACAQCCFNVCLSRLPQIVRNAVNVQDLHGEDGIRPSRISFGQHGTDVTYVYVHTKIYSAASPRRKLFPPNVAAAESLTWAFFSFVFLPESWGKRLDPWTAMTRGR